MIATFKVRVALIVFFGFVFFGCGGNEEKIPNPFGKEVFFCDAEELTSEEDVKFYSDGNEFEGGIGRTSEESYEGEYSCLLQKDNMYGFTTTFDSLLPGEIFTVSVYRKSSDNSGTIVAQSVEGGYYYAEGVSSQTKDENGWDVLSLNIQMPQNVDSLKALKIYAFNSAKDQDKVYFDNFKIERFIRKKTDAKTNENALNIQLTNYDFASLQEFRDKAIVKKLISKKLKEEFEGFLKFKGKTYKIGIRLKGDWTDHLEGDKWSYRISVKEGQTIMGMKTFSIQNPSVRDYLNEYVIHKICDEEDLLTTKFDYVPVTINGIDFGIYNFEEHFEKQLVESKNRREGLILKFDEEGFWENILFYNENNIYPQTPFYEASVITPFKKKKLSKSPKHFEQFLIAQNLLLKYKQGDEDLNNYVDVEKLAKAYAVMDLGNVDHAYAWHNQRFYYNPVISKLELITYDCYSKPGDARKRDFAIKGNLDKGTHFINPNKYGVMNVFDNPSFLNIYLKYLKKYSSESYVNSILEKNKLEIDSLNSMIKKEYNFYDYDYSFLANNAKKIRQQLSDYENKVNNNAIKFEQKTDMKFTCASTKPFKHVSLNAYLQELKPNKSVSLKLQNYHCLPITVIGYSTKNNPDSLIGISKKVKLASYSNNIKTHNLSLKEKPKKLFYKVDGEKTDSIYSAKIISWQIPIKTLNNIKTSTLLNTNSKVYNLKNDTLIFKKGKHIIKESIVIPAGKTVIFEPGTELVLNNKLFFMSYSALKMKGTEKEPIKIVSTDGTANGFTVLQTKKISELSYVIFDGLNTLNKNGWSLTGAVTFYESKVNIDNSSFNNNNCEDGLNIIRSEFKLTNSKISNTFSDGFDADFCKGIISNCTFNQTGNDCLDFSGSTITVENCELRFSGDKGISCGEASTVNINKVNIFNAVLGVASKDNSTVNINMIYLKDCTTGFSAFQKKSEYGPSLINVDKYILDGVIKATKIEVGSEINLKNKLKNPKPIEAYIEGIKTDKKWMEEIRKKAKKRNISEEEMIALDANYMFNKNDLWK